MTGARRGQGLVLWALCLLLLSLLVVMNLSIAQRARERMELQELADASAYNQATLTARYFNAIAVLNRASAADGVALAAHQAVVSYASFARSSLHDVRGGLEVIKGSFDACCNNLACAKRACACGEASQVGAAIANLDAFRDQSYPDALWKALDLGAGFEFRDMHQHARDLDVTRSRLAGAFASTGGLIDHATRRTVESSAGTQLAAGELRVPFDQQIPRSSSVPRSAFAPYQRSLMVMGTTQFNYFGAEPYDVLPMVSAVHAARPNTFVTARQSMAPQVQALVRTALGGQAGNVGWTPKKLEGSSGFGFQLETAATYGGARNRDCVAHEHTEVDAWSWKGGAACAGLGQPNSTAPASTVRAFLITSSLGSGGGGSAEAAHYYDAANEPLANLNHDVGSAAGLGMLNDSVELNQEFLPQESMLFGQPLFPSLVVRDLSVAPRSPWDLRFTFGFSREGTSLDIAKRKGGLSRQVAMAGGLAYYHRAARLARPPPPAGPPPPIVPSVVPPSGELSSWKEPANLWNPFWRASLFLSGQGPRQVVQNGITSTPGDDRVYWLEQYGYSDEADTLSKLTAAGYRGTR